MNLREIASFLPFIGPYKYFTVRYKKILEKKQIKPGPRVYTGKERESNWSQQLFNGLAAHFRNNSGGSVLSRRSAGQRCNGQPPHFGCLDSDKSRVANCGGKTLGHNGLVRTLTTVHSERERGGGKRPHENREGARKDKMVLSVVKAQLPRLGSATSATENATLTWN